MESEYDSGWIAMQHVIDALIAERDRYKAALEEIASTTFDATAVLRAEEALSTIPTEGAKP